MGKVSFYITKERIRLVYYTLPGQRIQWFVGEVIDPNEWDKKKQRAIPSNKSNVYLNDLLDNISSYITEQRRLFKIEDKILDSSTLENLLNVRYKKAEEDKPMTFQQYVNLWIERKEGTVGNSTLMNYRNSINRILNTHKNLNWEAFNKTWAQVAMKKLKAYSVKAKDGRAAVSGYTHNSAVKALSVLRTILIDAEIDGYHNNQKFKVRNWVPAYEEAETIYLSTEELETLYNHDYGKRVGVRNAVNLFLVGCYTGQRWSTFSTINKSLIYEHKGVKMISIRQKEKNKSQISIPIVSHILEEILEKGYRKISSQNLRDHIKEAAKECGKEKWEKVGTHTARRSFATNMLIAGVPKNLIMSITGHKTEKEFNKYVKYTDIQAAIKAAPWVKEVFG